MAGWGRRGGIVGGGSVAGVSVGWHDMPGGRSVYYVVLVIQRAKILPLYWQVAARFSFSPGHMSLPGSSVLPISKMACYVCLCCFC